MTDDLIGRTISQFTRLPSPETEVADLTESEKIALCIAAGCETEWVEGVGASMTLTVRTVRPVGIAKINGRFVVYHLTYRPAFSFP